MDNVRSTAHDAIHLQFEIIANGFEIRAGDLDKVTSLRSETISKFVIVSEISKNFGRQCHLLVAFVMVNCLNIKKYILSIVSENFAVSVSQKVSDFKSKSHDLSWLVSIP
jgi:hypothetical protein